MIIWTLSSGDHPLGRGSYNSAVELYNLIQKLILEDDFFIKKPDAPLPKENPDQDYELTDIAMIAYSMICNQFYIINLENDLQITKRSLNSVKNNLKIIKKFFQEK